MTKKLAPAAHHVLLSILVMTSPHLTSGRQFWLITHDSELDNADGVPHSVSTQLDVPGGELHIYIYMNLQECYDIAFISYHGI